MEFEILIIAGVSFVPTNPPTPIAPFEITLAKFLTLFIVVFPATLHT